jgi:hypothetical protein
VPLLDHFRPPLSKQRPWEGFHAAWANALVERLNDKLLPSGYVALPLVTVGGRVEIDVATTTDAMSKNGGVATATWAPPAPTLVEPIDFAELDAFEVRVFREDDSPRLVAAIELVSPANKDRAGHRRAFVIKCAGYLQQGASVVVADVVTTRSADLHGDLLRLLRLPAGPRRSRSRDLFAAAYRSAGEDGEARIEAWLHRLRLGEKLPTMPLWIAEERCVGVDLEQTYQDARRRLRMR